MNEMVERVARAIHQAEYPDGSYEGFVTHTPDPQKFIRQARAAIEAMREPTIEMWDTLNSKDWDATIDAALSSSKPKSDVA